jgi:GxxExxY protein
MSESARPAAEFEDLTFKIIGSAMRVHNQLGPGHKEIAYHNAMSHAMQDAGLSFEEEMPVNVEFEGEWVGLLYLDHFVEGKVVVEEKALSHLLTDEETAQVITYLAATDAPVGLLLNFGRSRLQYKRILPPRKFTEWRERARRYAWRPPGQPATGNPLVRASSVDDRGPA